MTSEHAESEYVTGQYRPTFPAMLAGYEARAADAVQSERCELDLPYGSRPRETFDLFVAHGAARGVLVYFHAGYWQSRDKSGFRFLAPAFTRRGLHVALVNYPLCPTVDLATLLDSARRSIPAIGACVAARADDAAQASGDPARARRSMPLIVSGHSAGAHIAIELALTRPTLDVAAVIALSGIYDLLPLIDTTLNRNLKLDAESARTHSPLFRVAAGSAPALFAVGAAETTAFVEQSRRMHDAWLARGNRSTLQVVHGADHFSVLGEFVTEGSVLAERVMQMLAFEP
ncbi:MAG: alpha/beta hydrolase [Burkholderiaceae bacterium]|nr:alpha/beta hydrolase [Burkholderiaceae bacterium]